MLLLTSTSDQVLLDNSAAGSIQAHASYMDNNAGTITPGRQNTPTITGIVTGTVLVASPGSGVQRNVKEIIIHNESPTATNIVDAVHTDGTNRHDLIRCTLLPEETLILDGEGRWTHYTADGAVKSQTNLVSYNSSTAAQGAGFASDTYLTGSFILFPTAPKVGTKFKLKFDVSKTAAGTATPIITVRLGTAGSTADTARNTFTFSAGTAATDVGTFEVDCVFRAVGASAVLQGRCALTSQATTGISSLLKTQQSTSGSFDSTTAGLGIGVSVNGGASAAWTVQLVDAELVNTA